MGRQKKPERQSHAVALAKRRKRAKLVYAANKSLNVCVQTGCYRRGQMPRSPYCRACRVKGNLYTKEAKRRAREKRKVAA